MNKELFLDIFKDSIRAITNSRYLSSERAYQCALFAELKNKGNIEQIFSNSNVIIEQEYQKTRTLHGIKIRPDLIIHIPHETGTYDNRKSGNFIVIQLKRKASKSKAEEDFNKLDLMFKELDYPLGIFLNISSEKTFVECYKGNYRERLHCFAVRLVDDKVVVYEQ